MKKIFKIIFTFIIIYLTNHSFAFSQNEKIKIGLLAPLSGEYKELGQSIIKSTRMALNDIGTDRIEIYPMDTSIDPNQTLQSAIKLKNKGIKTIRSKVGHSYIKKIMRDNDADFGGEHSAHFYLRENFYADSGILTLLIFLKILSEKNIKSSELVQNYNFKPSSGEINYIVEDVETSLKKIEHSFEGEFDKLDGISYFSDDFWFNVRGSNTEPMLRLNAEAINQKTLDNIIEKISNIIS